MIKLLFLFLPIISFAQEYRIEPGKLCDGYPQISVGSLENSCVGIVASIQTKDSNGQTFKFPRKILELQPNVFLITDMGGWEPYRGKIWLLDLKQKKLKVVLDKLTLPHGIAQGPDGLIYIGEMGLIFRFNPLEPNPASTCETVIHDLPSTIQRTRGNPCLPTTAAPATNIISHPLVSFTFSEHAPTKWNLIVNTGSASDNCTDKNKTKKVDQNGRCIESDSQNPVASVRVYEYLGNNTWNPQGKILARGLRNSMVLISHESGNIIQMENSMDFPESTEPFEEINVLKEGRHYGWPYCFNFKGQNPLFAGFLCNEKNSIYEMPYALTPPHTAPLDAVYYNGNLFPELQNHLIVSWHGYRGAGQRVVSYPTNTDGLPYVNRDSFFYNSFENNKTIKIKANPKGGLIQSAPYQELIYDWYAVKSIRPRGAPVGLTIASDGSIFIVEDKNKTILRLSRGQNSKDTNTGNNSKLDDKILNNAELMKRWSVISKNILQPQCATCHVQVQNKDPKESLKTIYSMGWIVPGNGPESLMVKRMKGGEMRLMPPAGPLKPDEIQSIETFISDLR